MESLVNPDAFVVHTPRPGNSWNADADVADPSSPTDTLDCDTPARVIGIAAVPMKETPAPPVVADEVDAPTPSQ